MCLCLRYLVAIQFIFQFCWAHSNPCDRFLTTTSTLPPIERVEIKRVDLSSFFEFARINLSDFNQTYLNQFTVSPDGRWIGATRVGDEGYVLLSQLNRTQNKVANNFAIRLKNNQKAIHIALVSQPARLFVLVKQPNITNQDFHYNLLIYNLQNKQFNPISLLKPEQATQILMVDQPQAMSRIYLASIKGAPESLLAFKLALDTGKLETLGYAQLSALQISHLMNTNTIPSPHWYVTSHENQILQMGSENYQMTFNFATHQTESKIQWKGISNYTAPWIEFLPKSKQAINKVTFRDHFNQGRLIDLSLPNSYNPILENVIPISQQHYLVQVKSQEPVIRAIRKLTHFTFIKWSDHSEPYLLPESQVWMRQVVYPNAFFGLQLSDNGEGELFSLSH